MTDPDNRYVRANGYVVGPGASLVGVDLSGCDLAGVDLSAANLVGVNFSNCNLKNVDFTSANLVGAVFSGADTDGAVFDFANMVGVQGLNIGVGADSSMRIRQEGHVVNSESQEQRSRTRAQDQGQKPSRSLFARLLNNLSERKREVSVQASVRSTEPGCPNCGSLDFNDVPLAWGAGRGSHPVHLGETPDGLVRLCRSCGELLTPGNWS